jgi:amino acid permease
MLAYAMSVYSGIVLIRCLYYKPGHRIHDFKEIGVAAFSWPGYIVSSCLHLLNLFGCPALYLVLAGGNMVILLKGTVSSNLRFQTPPSIPVKSKNSQFHPSLLLYSGR